MILKGLVFAPPPLLPLLPAVVGVDDVLLLDELHAAATSDTDAAAASSGTNLLDERI
jgi:hypothetical protein